MKQDPECARAADEIEFHNDLCNDDAPALEIATLRAEVERLTKEQTNIINGWTAETTDLRAEVERLKAFEVIGEDNYWCKQYRTALAEVAYEKRCRDANLKAYNELRAEMKREKKAHMELAASYHDATDRIKELEVVLEMIGKGLCDADGAYLLARDALSGSAKPASE